MAEFQIATDSTSDLPAEYFKEHNVAHIDLCYTMSDVTYGGDTGKELAHKDFYEQMRGGQMPTTSQINPEEAKRHFEKYYNDGAREILYLAFSSGLSGTYGSACIAAQDVMEDHPDCKIMVVDSLCASLGEGLFVHKAVQMRDAGKSLEETAEWMTAHVQNIVHMFTVDDLNHLFRGGRVSRSTAFFGTLASIKPILHVDAEGHLIAVDKVRGRKKSLITLVDYMEKKIGSYRDKNDIVFISHGDSEEDAKFVAEEVKKRFGVESFLINNIGPVIGAHAGPGTIALFFMGDER